MAIPVLKDTLALKLKVSRQENLTHLRSTVWQGKYTKIAFVKVYTYDADDGSEEYYISDYQAKMLLDCGIERDVKYEVTSAVGTTPAEFAIKKVLFPKLHSYTLVEPPQAVYRTFKNADLLPYVYAKRMYELIIKHGFKLPMAATRTPEKAKFFIASCSFMTWDMYPALYNDYSRKIEDNQFCVVPEPPEQMKVLDPIKLAVDHMEIKGDMFCRTAEIIKDCELNGVNFARGTEFELDPKENPEYFKIIQLTGVNLAAMVNKTSKKFLTEYTIAPEKFDFDEVKPESHAKSLVQLVSTLTLLLMHKPNNNMANTAKYIEQRKKAYFNSINDPNESKIKISTMMSDSDLVESSRYLKFYPEFYKQLYSMVLVCEIPWGSYAKTLLSSAQCTMYNTIFKFITSPVKTKLHTFQEVLHEMVIWKQKYLAVLDILPLNLVPYYKLYYPGGKLTDCHDMGTLCVAAFTWYCYKDTVAAGSMTNYGLAKNYFSKQFLRMAMTPVPDELYGEASMGGMQEFQEELKDLPGWNINLNLLLQRDAKGKRTIVFEDVKTHSLSDFFTQFTSRIPASAAAP